MSRTPYLDAWIREKTAAIPRPIGALDELLSGMRAGSSVRRMRPLLDEEFSAANPTFRRLMAEKVGPEFTEFKRIIHEDARPWMDEWKRSQHADLPSGPLPFSGVGAGLGFIAPEIALGTGAAGILGHQLLSGDE